MGRIVFHVDMDAFYVSCERRRDPALAGRPVVVGADPKEGRGRGVVMAASYEARALGVRSGTPISQAWRAAPEAVYLVPDFDLYGDVSESVIAVLRNFADVVEQASIDEAFLDATRRTTWEGVPAHAMAVKAAVLEREGITCTVGAAPNKSCAKIAGEQQKPDGLTVVRPEEVAAFLEPLPVRRISGIGPKTEAVLVGAGIRTIGELARFPGEELKKLLGRNAVWLWGIARGEEQLPVEERPDPKSLSVERTFQRDAEDWSVVLDTLDDIADNLWQRARVQKVRFKNVGVRLRFTGFETHLRQRVLPAASDDPAILRQVARELVAEFRGSERPIRMLGVRIAMLEKARGEQRKLL
jgi:DNA polymerase IV (DinB-like DNA polymerase)